MELSDDQLVARAREGSEEAMIAIYERHRGRLIAYARRLTGDGDLAEEIFCQTFAAFYQAIEDYEPRGRLLNYLLRIVHTKLATERKAAARLRGLPPDVHAQVLSRDPSPDARLLAAEACEQIGCFLADLPVDLRAVVTLRVYEGLSYAEVAEITGVGEATVRSRMRYALQALRKRMAEWGSVSK